MAVPSSYKTTSGSTRWRVRGQVNGQNVHKAGFRTKTEANQWWKQQEAKVRLELAETTDKTLADVIKLYLKEGGPFHDLSQSTQRTRKTELAYWQDRLGRKKLTDITPQVIARELDALRERPGRSGKPMSKATIRKYYTALQALFTASMKRWHFIKFSPFMQMDAPPDGEARDRTLTNEEMQRLLEALESSRSLHLADAVMLMLLTGCRSGEAKGLKWADVDLDRQRVHFIDTKNGTSRAALITASMVKRLESVKQFTGHLEYVFANPTTGKPMNIRKAFETARARVGLSDVRLHDLRHHVASTLARQGVTLRQLADQLGHKTLSQVMRYSHLSEESVGGGASIIEAALGQGVAK